MIDCQHAKRFTGIVHCQLIGRGFSESAAPCERCQSEWVDGDPPTRDKLPPVLVDITKGRLPKPNAVAPRRQMPTLIVRMKSFSMAFARWLAGGGKILPDEESNARLAICAECPDRTKYFLADACGICGCALTIKSKWPEQSCPLKLWPGDADKPPCGKPCGGKK